MYLLDFPPEILYRIVESVGSVWNINSTCRLFRDICDDPLLRKGMNIPLSMVPLPEIVGIPTTLDLVPGDIVALIQEHEITAPFIIIRDGGDFYDIIFPSMRMESSTEDSIDDLVRFGPCLLRNNCFINAEKRRLLRSMHHYDRFCISEQIRIQRIQLDQEPPDDLYRISRIDKHQIIDAFYFSERGRVGRGVKIPFIYINPCFEMQ